MELFDAIFSRHSNANVKPDPVPRELIEKMLDAAVQAPNHYKVRPWRFVVFSGAGREQLGEALAQMRLTKNPTATDQLLAIERALPFRAPVVIAIGVEKPDEPKVLEIENIVATACAAENLLLA